MSDAQTKALKRWVKTWKEAAVAIEAVRISEIRQVDSAAAIRSLASNFAWAKRVIPLAQSSGLVELQRLFSKLRTR